MSNILKTLLSCCIALSIAGCGASGGGGAGAPAPEGTDLGPVWGAQNIQDIDYDGSAPTQQAALRDDVMKQEWVEVPYQDTCVRQVPDGYNTICETRYRNEQQCGYEQVCNNEQQCRIEQKCTNQQQCTTERECRIENKCTVNQVCHNEQYCTTKPVCTTKQECRDQQVCKEERKCEVVNGVRICKVHNVCVNQPVCKPVQTCHNENVCTTRPVCRDERQCRDERVCHDVPKCSWVPVCRDERVCNWVPVCRNEYKCHTVSVPYQDCRQEPRYRDEYYACTKTRPEQQTVLDYHHVVDVKVVFDGVALPTGAKDKFRVYTQDGRVDLQAVQIVSGLAYYHTVSSQTQQIGQYDRLTTTLITVRAVDALAANDIAKIVSLRADKSAVTIEKMPLPMISDFDLKVKLTVRRDAAAPLIDRDLLPSEFRLGAPGPRSQMIDITFRDLRLDRDTALRGNFTVDAELRLQPMAPWALTDANLTPLMSVQQTLFRN